MNNNNHKNNKQRGIAPKKKDKTKKTPKVAVIEDPERYLGLAASYAEKAATCKPALRMESGATVIRHTELIGTVYGYSAWTPNATLIQPGFSVSFPWLSQVASSYEQYRFRKLKFRFMTSVGTNVGGNVYMIPDYDAGDTSPPTEAKGLVNDKGTGGVPWANYTVSLPTSNLHPNGRRKFTRHAGLLAFSDLRTFDCGNLFVCTVGCTESSVIGRLFVEYEIELFVPQYDTTVTNTVIAGTMANVVQYNMGVDGYVGWIARTILGNLNESGGAIVSQYTNAGEALSGSGGTVLFDSVIPGMAYKFILRMASTSATFTSFLPTSGGSIATVLNSYSFFGAGYGIYEAVLVFSATGGYLNMSFAGTLSGLWNWVLDVQLIQVPASLAALSAGLVHWEDLKDKPLQGLANGVPHEIKRDPEADVRKTMRSLMPPPCAQIRRR